MGNFAKLFLKYGGKDFFAGSRDSFELDFGFGAAETSARESSEDLAAKGQPPRESAPCAWSGASFCGTCRCAVGRCARSSKAGNGPEPEVG